MSEALLSVRGIHTYYGDSYVLQGLDLELREGTIVAILGRNGMGKTTLIRSVAGLTPPREGEVTFKGRSLRGRPAYAIAQSGMAIVPQGRRIFRSLTVRENLLLPTSVLAGRRAAAAESGQRRWDLAGVLAEFPQLAERIGHLGGALSGGEQQMLAIGRALMARPKLMLLDEPSLGLAPLLVREIFEIIKRINEEEKATILLVEQNARVALSIAHYGYIMENGKIVLDDTVEKLKENEDIKEFYLGLSQVGGKKSFRDVKHYRRRKRWLS